MRKVLFFFVITVVAALFLPSCAVSGFKGFYEENLDKYLTLGEYKGLSYTEENIEVSAEEVEAEIEKRLKSLSQLVETENGIKKDSTVKFERFCFINGESTPELSKSGTYLFADSETDKVALILLSQMSGMKKGEGKDIEIIIPKGYISESSAETKATFRVTVLSVYERVNAVLDDENAEKLIPNCGGVDGCREAIKEEIKIQKQVDLKYKKESELWDRVVESSILSDAPYDVYNAHYEVLYSSYRGLAEAQSEELEDYIAKSYDMTRSEFEKMLGDRALSMTKESFVLYSIVKKEGVAYTEKELSDYAELCAQLSDGVFDSGDDYLAFYGEDAVSEQYLKEKVLEIIVANTKPSK